MHKLASMIALLCIPSLALAQAAAEPPLEAQAGTGAVIAFGIIVLVGVVWFIVFMVRHNARKGQSQSGATE